MDIATCRKTWRYAEGLTGTTVHGSYRSLFRLTGNRVEPEHSLTQIHVVLNWFEELKRRVPAGR